MPEPCEAERLRIAQDAPVNPAGAYVLYWMAAARRTTWNLALERAVAWARELGKPLLVFEGLRAGYPHASARLHRFVIDGMRDNAARCAAAGVGYFPWVEPRDGDGKGLLAAIAAEACVVVVDETPVFFLPHAIAAFAARCPVRLEAVDGVGVLPLAVSESPFPTALAFRRHAQRHWPTWLQRFPRPDPLAGAGLPPFGGLDLGGRWAPASARVLAGDFAGLDVPSSPAPVAQRGGPVAGAERLAAFVRERLPAYGERNDPSRTATSGLSPYLHFGHVGAHQVLAAVLAAGGWTPERLPGRATGSRAGWWGLDAASEGFLDELLVWRELGQVAAHREPGTYDRYEGLPAWARTTLERHSDDPRPWRYDRDALERSATHDPIWNAAQRQLVRDGTIHNYLRMLWGKNILAWSDAPADALATMFALNDAYALDGRDPNSASGITWVLGRYDRPWGPERPIFGTVRYMTSANTARKFDLKAYLARYGPS